MKHTHLPRANGMVTFMLSAIIAAFGVTAQAAPTASSAGAANPATTEHLQEIMKASKFLGTNVVDSQNNKVGEVKDMAIDIRNSRINYVVISTGGIAGMGNKLRALPPHAVVAARTNDDITLKVSPQILKESPTLPDKDWISAIDQKALGAMYQRMGANLPVDGEAPQVLAASELIGRPVITGREEKTGAEVKDLTVDVRAGRVPFAILEFGALTGAAGGKWIPVPTAVLSKSELKDSIRIDITAHDLANGREIDKDNWVRVLADPSAAAKLYATFGVTPYWTQASAEGGATSKSMPNRPAAGASQTPPAENIQHKGN